MKLLVVGGAGYVGSTSVERFLEAGHEVIVYDNLSSGHRASLPDGARLVVGDIADTKRTAEVLEGVDAVAVDPVDLRPGHGQAGGQGPGVEARVAEGGEPLEGDAHQNCSRNRRSLS